MTNLTQHLNVVGPEQAGMHPKPGWFLVVLKQVGEGRIFHSLLQPGESRAPGVFERMFKQNTNLVSIPVNADQELRHEFTSPVAHVSPGHSFEADYRMEFSVGVPELVATRWIQDPLRKIEQEIRRRLDSAARTVEWTELREEILLDGALALRRRQVDDALETLQDFASTYGIQIVKLYSTLRLSNKDAEPDVALAEAVRYRKLAAAGKEQKLADVHVTYDVEDQKAVREAQLRDRQRIEEIMNAGTRGIVTTLEQGTAHPDELPRLIREVGNAFRQSVGSSSGGLSPVPSLGGALPLALTSGETNQKLTNLIGYAIQLVESLAIDRPSKQELLASFLHSIAEASRGRKADTEAAAKYSSAAADVIGKLNNLDRNQHTDLRRLANFEYVRDQLVKEEVQ